MAVCKRRLQILVALLPSSMSIESKLVAMNQQLAQLLAERGDGASQGSAVSTEKLRAFVLERTQVHDKELREISLGLCRKLRLPISCEIEGPNWLSLQANRSSATTRCESASGTAPRLRH